MEKKSFLKGLFIGIGGTLLTALLGITIYGCASINAKGAKAVNSAITIHDYNGSVKENGWTVDLTVNGRYLALSASNSDLVTGDEYYFEFGSIYNGGFHCYLGCNTDGDLISDINGNVTTTDHWETAEGYWFIGDCPELYSVVWYFQSGGADDSGSMEGPITDYDYATTLNSEGVITLYQFTLENEGGWIIDNPPSSSSDSGSSTDASSSNSEAIYWEEFTFPRDIYPQEVFPSVTWGNAGYGPDLTGTRNVYLDMQIRYQGQFWDSVLFRYIDASSGELTRYRWASGEEADMGSGALVNPHYYYCASIQLYRTYSVGPSSYGSTFYELARVPSAVSNGGTPFQDTRLQWLVNDRTIEVYSADLSNRPSVWSGGFWDNSIDNRQYLNIIGATNSGGGGSGGDADMSGVFALISQAFEAVAVVFNIQVFPFATLGMFMLIPLVVAIVLFVVGLFKR